MKRSFIIILLLFISEIVFSQTLVSENNLWSNLVYDYDYVVAPYIISTEHIKFEGDTILGSENYKKVWRSTNPNQTNWSSYGFIREDSNKILYKHNGSAQDRLLYDFNLSLGDTVNAFQYVGGTFIAVTYLVSDIQYNGGVVISYKLNFTDNNSSTYYDEEWIVGIGSRSGILHNKTDFCGSDYHELLCFNSVSMHPNYQTCYYESGTKVENYNANNLDVVIKPNPINSVSKLIVNNCTENDVIKLEIFNSNGQKITNRIINSQYLLNAETMEKGLYFYRITKNEMFQKVGKFIVN